MLRLTLPRPFLRARLPALAPLLAALALSGCDPDTDKDGFDPFEDCDNEDPAIHPGADEIPYDGQDNDCDAATPDDDLDGDGAGSSDLGGDDCDDNDPARSPSTAEIWYDGIDNDCDEATVDDDQDGDGAASADHGGDDCDDQEPLIHPGAAESCNYADDDCDGQIDEDLQIVLWTDSDRDGYGDAAAPVMGCGPGGGRVDNDLDCDDTRATTYPGAAEIPYDDLDNDCDPATDDDDADTDGWTADEDCDDADPTSFPGNPEICDGADNNCDGAADEGVTTTFYADADADGYGSVSATTQACARPAGYTDAPTDCDDSRADANPGAAETCNGADDDCDGAADEGVLPTWYADRDADGFGDPAAPALTCVAPPGHVADGTDCDDAHPEALPGGVEVCDGLDNDCSGAADEGLTATYYADTDADGYGDPAAPLAACGLPSGYAADSADCDDADPAAFPGNPEVCDSADNDCDGSADEGVTSTFYTDADGDGYGEPSATAQGCTAPTGYAPTADDCDDSDPLTSPGAPEVCLDGAVNACTGDIAAALAACPALPSGTASADWTITGEQADAGLGAAVAAADLDADGDADPILGSARYDLGSQDSVGAVYLPRRYASASVSTLSPTRLIGEDALGYAGSAVIAPGDLTGDGNPDVAAGAPDALGTGAIYVRSGPFAAGSVGLWLSPAIRYGAAGSRFGSALAAGDSDGDGAPDLFVGAPADNGGAGAVYLLSGPLSGTAAASGGMPGSGGEAAGSALSAGDVDGDGLTDLLVGAPGAGSNDGAAYLLLAGSALSAPDLSAPDLRLTAPAGSAASAGSALQIADLDGDGYGDLIVAGEGSLWIVGGAALSASALDLSAADAALSDPDLTDPAIAAGDIDGDPYEDLLLGGSSGAAWLLRGPLPPGASALSAAATQRLTAPADALSVALGDLDGDGWDDALIGAPSGAGAAYILFTDGY